ncbi:MAG TPA: tetratricopeptide repeat protein [Saprospiraceae bacterium]|nr:tetratricopeptide repeat protein [Saprospiraceae bacterium]
MRFLFWPLAFYCLIWIGCTEAPSPATSAVPETGAPDEEPESVAYRLNQVADSLRAEGKYQEAIQVYVAAMDSAQIDADSFGYYDAMLDQATVHERLMDFDKAIALAQTVVAAYERSGDTLRIGRAYSTMSGFYSHADRHEEQLAAAKKGFALLRNHPSLIHRCATYNQMAFVYSDAGNWAAALPLLDSALQYMIASEVLDQLPSMQLNVGNCYRNLKQWPQALQYLYAALSGADSLNQPHVKAKTLERIAQTEEASGSYANALTHFRESREILDSLLKAEKHRSIQELEVKFETRQKDQEIRTLQAEKATHRVISYWILTLSLCILGIGAMFYRRRRDKAIEVEKALVQSREDLQNLAHLLQEKNARIIEINEKQVTERPEEGEDVNPGDPSEGIYNLRILTDQDWAMFKTFFERSHPRFIQKMRDRFPQLTAAEERLLLLIKLKLSRQEIASTLGISPESVKKGRQRLRKKLGLEHEDVLESFIEEIE